MVFLKAEIKGEPKSISGLAGPGAVFPERQGHSQNALAGWVCQKADDEGKGNISGAFAVRIFPKVKGSGLSKNH